MEDKASPSEQNPFIQPEIRYEQMDKNVRQLVRALNELRINTTWSCEGHLEPSWKDSHPVIKVEAYDFETKSLYRLIELLGEWNRKNAEIYAPWIFLPLEGPVLSEGNSDKPFYFHNLYLQPVETNKNRQREILDTLQKSAVDLGEYLTNGR